MDLLCGTCAPVGVTLARGRAVLRLAVGHLSCRSDVTQNCGHSLTPESAPAVARLLASLGLRMTNLVMGLAVWRCPQKVCSLAESCGCGCRGLLPWPRPHGGAPSTDRCCVPE
jgi:hypothetical protein